MILRHLTGTGVDDKFRSFDINAATSSDACCDNTFLFFEIIFRSSINAKTGEKRRTLTMDCFVIIVMKPEQWHTFRIIICQRSSSPINYGWLSFFAPSRFVPCGDGGKNNFQYFMITFLILVRLVTWSFFKNSLWVAQKKVHRILLFNWDWNEGRRERKIDNMLLSTFSGIWNINK